MSERTPVSPEDIINILVNALDGAQVRGGLLSATVNGHEVNVHAHADDDESHHNSFNVLVH